MLRPLGAMPVRRRAGWISTTAALGTICLVSSPYSYCGAGELEQSTTGGRATSGHQQRASPNRPASNAITPSGRLERIHASSPQSEWQIRINAWPRMIQVISLSTAAYPFRT
jgi:hypothetical protein